MSTTPLVTGGTSDAPRRVKLSITLTLPSCGSSRSFVFTVANVAELRQQVKEILGFPVAILTVDDGTRSYKPLLDVSGLNTNARLLVHRCGKASTKSDRAEGGRVVSGSDEDAVCETDLELETDADIGLETDADDDYDSMELRVNGSMKCDPTEELTVTADDDLDSFAAEQRDLIASEERDLIDTDQLDPIAVRQSKPRSKSMHVPRPDTEPSPTLTRTSRTVEEVAAGGGKGTRRKGLQSVIADSKGALTRAFMRTERSSSSPTEKTSGEGAASKAESRLSLRGSKRKSSTPLPSPKASESVGRSVSTGSNASRTGSGGSGSSTSPRTPTSDVGILERLHMKRSASFNSKSSRLLQASTDLGEHRSLTRLQLDLLRLSRLLSTWLLRDAEVIGHEDALSLDCAIDDDDFEALWGQDILTKKSVEDFLVRFEKQVSLLEQEYPIDMFGRMRQCVRGSDVLSWVQRNIPRETADSPKPECSTERALAIAQHLVTMGAVEAALPYAQPFFAEGYYVRQTDANKANEKIEFITRLGRVGCGRDSELVYALDSRTETHLVVKRVKRSCEEKLACARKEARLLASLSHPNIPRGTHWSDQTHFHLGLEPLYGGRVFNTLIACERFSERVISKVIADAASVLEFLHEQRYVYRNMELRNMVMTNDSWPPTIKLIDYANAVTLSNDDGLEFRANRYGQSMLFQAPEQLLEKRCDFSVDIWSLGICMYVLLSGYLPFYSTDPKSLAKMMEERVTFSGPGWHAVSPNARSLLRRMLCHNPRKRLSASEILQHPWVRGIDVSDEDTLYYNSIVWETLGQIEESIKLGGDRSEAKRPRKKASVPTIEEEPQLHTVLITGGTEELRTEFRQQLKAASLETTMERLADEDLHSSMLTFEDAEYMMVCSEPDPPFWRHQSSMVLTVVIIVDLRAIKASRLNGREVSLKLNNQLHNVSRIATDPLYNDLSGRPRCNTSLILVFCGVDHFFQEWSAIEDLERQWPWYKPGDDYTSAQNNIKELFLQGVPAHRKAATIYAESPLEALKLIHSETQARYNLGMPTDWDKVFKNRVSHKVETINLRLVQLKKKHGSAFVVSKKELSSLSDVLKKPKAALRHLSLENLGLRPREIELLAVGLERNKHLEVLELSYNPLGDEGVSVLAKVLSPHPAITDLRLGRTGLGCSGLHSIASLLCNTMSLRSLDLSENTAIGHIGMGALCAALGTNNTLQQLHLWGCQLKTSAALSLSGAMRQNYTLQLLDIEGNHFYVDATRHILDALSLTTNSSLHCIFFKPMVCDSDSRRKLEELKAMSLSRLKRSEGKQYDTKEQQLELWQSIRESDPTLASHAQQLRMSSYQQKNVSLLDLGNYQLKQLHIVPQLVNEVCGSLVQLFLDDNSLSEFPTELCKLSALQVLVLTRNQLTALPEKISALCSLTHLDIAQNSLKELPSSIKALNSLQELDLRHNSLTVLPTEVCQLRELRRLYLQSNKISEALPESIFQLTNLCELLVAMNGMRPAVLETIYQAFGWRLGALDLSYCRLSRFPLELAHLTPLSDLNLEHNELEVLPMQLGSLTNLRSLNISHNKLQNMMAVASLQRLERLSFEGNPLTELPKEIFTMNTAAVLEHLKSIQRTKVAFNRAKLMMVGKENVGKTHLAMLLKSYAEKRKLKKKDFKHFAAEPTDGIDIDQWTSHCAENPITFSVWDFAGRDAYFTTHAFFLAQRSVFCLLFDLTKPLERQRVGQWLQIIKTTAPSSPVLLVGTHMEATQSSALEALPDKIQALIRKAVGEFPNLFGIVPVSCTALRNIDVLYQEIIEAARAQSYMGEMKFSSYQQLELETKQRRLQMSVPVITMQEFENMVLMCGINNSSGQTVAEFLNDLGTVVFFNDKKLGFSQRVILDPAWLVRLISTIVTVKKTCVKDGVLYHRDFEQIWSGPSFPPSHHNDLIQLLNKMEIAYSFPSDDAASAYSWIPSMFPARRPLIEGTWISVDEYLTLSGSQQVERIYIFDFLPFGFFSRLIVRLLHFTNPQYTWRTGMVLEHGKEFALIEFEPHGMELSVKVRGLDPSRLLRIIVNSLDLLMNGWYTLKANVVIPFVLKGYHGMEVKPQFGLEELEHAAAFGSTDKTFNDIPIRIDSIAPDLVLADLDHIKLDYERDLQMEKCIGEGGFGLVYRARYKDEVVAVKEVKVEDAMKVEAYREFRHEVALCCQLQHPNIVLLKGVCLNPWCLIMEYMAYGNLYDFLKDKSNEIDWPRRIRMAHNIADAIRFLHSFAPKIIHRDLKTPNCLIADTSPDAVNIVKVTDFGESRAVATTYTGRDRLANPVWLAPEIMRKEEYTEKADVYSYGIIMWELLCREKPFDEYPVAQSDFVYELEDAIIGGLRPTIPEDCLTEYEYLTKDCWDGDPKKRPTFVQICNRLGDMMP